MTDDLDPKQAASMLMQQHGDKAAQYAAQWAAALLEAGNREAAQRFARIRDAIRTMTEILPDGRPPPRRNTPRRRAT
ncbi:MAG TPA: hypothetical protein VMQ11_13295 [Alphaproteobacteria bacterium]|nr:hypothetical protein [Alphaproteobacteria bacterium]